jgi:hypothetical protein
MAPAKMAVHARAFDRSGYRGTTLRAVLSMTETATTDDLIVLDRQRTPSRFASWS